jgi:hypothetical protein
MEQTTQSLASPASRECHAAAFCPQITGKIGSERGQRQARFKLMFLMRLNDRTVKTGSFCGLLFDHGFGLCQPSIGVLNQGFALFILAGIRLSETVACMLHVDFPSRIHKSVLCVG